VFEELGVEQTFAAGTVWRPPQFRKQLVVLLPRAAIPELGFALRALSLLATLAQNVLGVLDSLEKLFE